MDNKKKAMPQRKRLAALFVSFTIVTVGAVSLLENMSLDYYSVIGTLQKVLPASLIMGGLGWVMGMILDRPKKGHRVSYNAMFLNEITKNTPSVDESAPEIPDEPVTSEESKE